MNNIPSDEEFERASRQMEESSLNLDRVRVLFKQHFKNRCPLHEFYILPQRDVKYRSYVFFEKNSDIEKYMTEGIVQEMKEFVLKNLEIFGRGGKEETTVAFELDSDENVKANYEGDYFLRMR